MRVLVCGDREWTASEPIATLLNLCPPNTVVIHGAARGADTIAGRLATELGFEVQPYPADWSKHGKAAGPIRNSQMLAEGQPDEVHAFHNNIDASRGTKDMVEKARKAGVPVIVHTW
jgi:hypothetical protein